MYISQNKLSTKLFTKPTDRPSYLHYNSYHPRAQKENIPSGQALRLKRICSENKHLQEGLKSLKTKFIQRGYRESLIEQQFSKINEYNRNDQLTYNNKEEKPPKLTCAVVFNKSLPNIKSSIHKHWNLLHRNKDISKKFTEEPLIAYEKNKTTRNTLGPIHLSKNKRIVTKQLTIGGSKQCLSQVGNICCKQTKSTNTFHSEYTKKTYKIFHNLNCHSKFLNYLGYCILCLKTQYVGKCESPWNIRLNNHRKDFFKT